MPLRKQTKDRIYNTVWHLIRHKDIVEFKFGITRVGISKRFYPHKKLEGFEYIVSLADNLKCDDALDLEKDISDWAAKEAKKKPGEEHVYKKYVHKDEEFAYSHGPGKKGRGRNYSVYMVWYTR